MQPLTFDPPAVGSTAAFIAVVVAVLAMVLAGSAWAAARQGSDWRAALGRSGLLLVAWLLVTSAPVVAGLLQRSALPGLPLFFGAVLVGAVLFAVGGPGRRLAALPLPALVAFQGFRLPLELVLHSWAEQGAIPWTMTYDGQNFDIVTGVLALLLAPLAARSARVARVFNILGMALLANVIRVVVMSSPLPFAWQVEPPLVLAAFAPYHLIGTVCVAGALVGHLVLLRAVAARRGAVAGR